MRSKTHTTPGRGESQGLCADHLWRGTSPSCSRLLLSWCVASASAVPVFVVVFLGLEGFDAGVIVQRFDESPFGSPFVQVLECVLSDDDQPVGDHTDHGDYPQPMPPVLWGYVHGDHLRRSCVLLACSSCPRPLSGLCSSVPRPVLLCPRGWPSMRGSPARYAGSNP